MKDKPENQSKSSIDDVIREALDQDEQELRRHYHRDPSLLKFFFSNFRGRMGWVAWFELCCKVGLLVFGVFCFDFAFTTELDREALVWASCGIISFVFVGQIELWFWIEGGRRSLTDEIRRLELQVARLGADKE
jgi:hypothetical protein